MPGQNFAGCFDSKNTTHERVELVKMANKKEVNVTFAGDDDILAHIISINERESKC